MKQITNGCFNFNATTVIYVWTYDLVDDLKQVAVFWSIFLFQVQTLPLVPMNFNTLLMRTLPSRQILVPRTSSKDPIWSSEGRPNLMSWERPEIKFLGGPNLTFKRSTCEDYWGRSHDICSAYRRGPSKHVLWTMWGH